MRKIFIFSLSLVCLSVFSQKAAPILFSEPYFDFGNIAESGGTVEHVFTFTNNSGLPLRLTAVEAACGCTTSEWPADIIQPGKSGKIKATFNPAGRPGFFNKSISILTEPELGPITIQIRGNVTTGKKIADEPLTHAVGQLNTRASTFNLGKVFINTEPTKQNFEIQNTGSETMEILGADKPDWITLNFPAKLKPGERGSLKIQYDGKKRNRFGFHSEQIILHTSDNTAPDKHYSVLVSLEEYFPELSPEELEKQPRLSLSASDLNFGSVSDSVIAKEITLRNSGKKTLSIRALIPNCVCLTAEVSTDKLEPGKSVKLSLKLIPGSRTGRQNKSVLIYSNDPVHPVQRITITGIVR